MAPGSPTSSRRAATRSRTRSPRGGRKGAYLAHLEGRSDAVLRVSLADKLFNARAILRDYLEVADALWERFRSGREGQLWYYRRLADAFCRLLPGRMARELDETVSELERLLSDGQCSSTHTTA